MKSDQPAVPQVPSALPVPDRRPERAGVGSLLNSAALILGGAALAQNIAKINGVPIPSSRADADRRSRHAAGIGTDSPTFTRSMVTKVRKRLTL